MKKTYQKHHSFEGFAGAGAGVPARRSDGRLGGDAGRRRGAVRRQVGGNVGVGTLSSVGPPPVAGAVPPARPSCGVL